MKKTILVSGAFDTKYNEHEYLIERIKSRGLEVMTLNFGVMEDPIGFKADIGSERVAEAGGASLEKLREEKDRGHAMAVMARGLAGVVRDLHRENRIQGMIGMGGTGGSSVVTAGMRALPIGFPKICVSTAASGNTEAYVGTKDVVLYPSIVDVAGLNSISRMIFSNAVDAVCGMVLHRESSITSDKPIITASMFGNTTQCVDACRTILSEKGFEILVFHATGTGGKTMESLVEDDLVSGVLDITTTEWADTLCGGVFDAGKARLDMPGRKGVPHLIVPGCIDMVNWGAPETIPEKYEGRLFYQWNPSVTLMRTTKEENFELGKIFAEKANSAQGPVAFLIPLKGFSILDSEIEGKPQLFWDPQADRAFIDGLQSKLDRSIEVTLLESNINDALFSEKAVEMLLGLM